MVILGQGYFVMWVKDHFCGSLSHYQVVGLNFLTIIGSSGWLCPTYVDGVYDVEDL